MVTLEKIQSPLFPKLYEAFLHDDDPFRSHLAFITEGQNLESDSGNEQDNEED